MTQQLAEFGKQEALDDEFSERSARTNKTIFLREAGISDTFDDLSPANKQVVIDVPLRLQLDKLYVPDHPETERDEIVSAIESKDVLPKTRGEAEDLLPRNLILSGLKRPAESNTKEAKNLAFTTSKALFEDAQADERVFGGIGIQAERGNDRITARWLRERREGQYLIADGLMAREFLDQGDWPETDSLGYFQRQSYWRGFMLMAAEYASDETLNDALAFFFDKSQKRRRYASKQYAAAGHRIGKRVIVSSEDTEPTEVWPGAREGKMPSDVMRHQLAAHASQTVRSDHYAEQNGGARAAAMKELGGKVPILNEAGEIIGSEDDDDMPTPEQLVRYELKEKERRRKRFAKRR